MSNHIVKCIFAISYSCKWHAKYSLSGSCSLLLLFVKKMLMHKSCILGFVLRVKEYCDLLFDLWWLTLWERDAWRKKMKLRFFVETRSKKGVKLTRFRGIGSIVLGLVQIGGTLAFTKKEASKSESYIIWENEIEREA